MLFDTTLSAEFMHVATTFGLAATDVVALARRSIDFGFCDDGVKATLRREFDSRVARIVVPLGAAATGSGTHAWSRACAVHGPSGSGVAKRTSHVGACSRRWHATWLVLVCLLIGVLVCVLLVATTQREPGARVPRPS